DEPGLRASFLEEIYALACFSDVCVFRYADETYGAAPSLSPEGPHRSGVFRRFRRTRPSTEATSSREETEAVRLRHAGNAPPHGVTPTARRSQADSPSHGSP